MRQISFEMATLGNKQNIVEISQELRSKKW